MKKLIILFAVAFALAACEKFKVEKSYELDKRIFIFPTAKIIGNNTQRLEVSVSQSEIGSDAVRRLQLDKLHFYIKNIKTDVERTIISDRTFVDVDDLTKNSEYLVTIEGFIDDRKSERSKEIFISTYPSPQKEPISSSFNYHGKNISDNFELEISITSPLNPLALELVIVKLIDFRNNTTEKIIEFSYTNSKSYKFTNWSDDSKKAFFMTDENNNIGIVYYDINKKAFISLPFSTTRKINQMRVLLDNRKVMYRVGTDVYIYNFDEKTELKLPVSMESFQWIKDKNLLAYRHTVTQIMNNKKYYLLSYFDLERMESKPIIKREIIPNMGDFKISPDHKKVIFGSNLAGGFDAWHYDITNDKFSMIPNESGVGQFNWLSNDAFVIIGYRGINSYRF